MPSPKGGSDLGAEIDGIQPHRVAVQVSRERLREWPVQRLSDLGDIMAISQVLHTIGQIFSQSFPPKPTFSAEDIPDLSGRVCIVTGKHPWPTISCLRLLLIQVSRRLCRDRQRDREGGDNQVSYQCHVSDRC